MVSESTTFSRSIGSLGSATAENEASCNMAESFKGQRKPYLIEMVGGAREAAFGRHRNRPTLAED